MMFPEIPVLSDKYKAAKECGFRYVESGYPYPEPLETVKKAKEESGLQQILINAWPGDLTKGDLGLAALPSRQAEFDEKLELSIAYAKALDCKRMHIQAGNKPKTADPDLEKTYLANIKNAADKLQKEGILALIEPLNTRHTAPNYFLYDIHTAVDYLKRMDHPNVKLQFDFFHIQIMDGNLTANIEKYLPYIGHIQVAQVPDRGEPNLHGEINYKYIFKMLEEKGYDGYIGLEYNPRGNTVEGLKWIQEMGLTL